MTTYKKMDPKIKAKWLTALRSGNYRQVEGALRGFTVAEDGLSQTNKIGYCCLGVLCNIESRHRWHKTTDDYDKDFRYGSVGMTELGDNLVTASTTMPPKVLAEKWGLSLAAAQRLAAMNDAGKPFDEIADWIEKHL